jgi:hypothetical protein
MIEIACYKIHAIIIMAASKPPGPIYSIVVVVVVVKARKNAIDISIVNAQEQIFN